MRRRRCRCLSVTYWNSRIVPNYAKRYRNATRPGFGMGMGANTLIHKGGKP